MDGGGGQQGDVEIRDVFLNLRRGCGGPVCCGDSHFSGMTAAWPGTDRPD